MQAYLTRFIFKIDYAYFSINDKYFQNGIQVIMFVILFVIISLQSQFSYNFNLISVFVLIASILLTSILSLGIGMIIASFTAKYKDLTHLTGLVLDY